MIDVFVINHFYMYECFCVLFVFVCVIAVVGDFNCKIISIW